jgi:hypothetical protein
VATRGRVPEAGRAGNCALAPSCAPGVGGKAGHILRGRVINNRQIDAVFRIAACSLGSMRLIHPFKSHHEYVYAAKDPPAWAARFSHSVGQHIAIVSQPSCSDVLYLRSFLSQPGHANVRRPIGGAQRIRLRALRRETASQSQELQLGSRTKMASAHPATCPAARPFIFPQWLCLSLLLRCVMPESSDTLYSSRTTRSRLAQMIRPGWTICPHLDLHVCTARLLLPPYQRSIWLRDL